MENYQRLSFGEREMIVQLMSQCKSVRFIAEALSRNMVRSVVKLVILPVVARPINQGCLIIVQIIFLQDIIVAEEYPVIQDCIALL